MVSEQRVTGAPTDPCRNYQLMELADRGLRHPNVTVSMDRANTCDYDIDKSMAAFDGRPELFYQQVAR